MSKRGASTVQALSDLLSEAEKAVRDLETTQVVHGPGALIAPKFARRQYAQDDTAEEEASDTEGVAPPGWEPAVKRLKKDGAKNPWALAWYLRHKGANPGKVGKGAEGSVPDEFYAQALRDTAFAMPDIFLAAGRGEAWAMSSLLTGNLVYQERISP